jgi:tetratricopeptide (TPR) repeat protein
MGRRGGFGRTKTEEVDELRTAKRGFNEARTEGNREEEARWANVIGDVHKRRGEYVEALKWLRIDYELSIKYLPQRQLLASCQSLGEVYLRLGRFSEALTYQVTPHSPLPQFICFFFLSSRVVQLKSGDRVLGWSFVLGDEIICLCSCILNHSVPYDIDM